MNLPVHAHAHNHAYAHNHAWCIVKVHIKAQYSDGIALLSIQNLATYVIQRNNYVTYTHTSITSYVNK